MPNGEVVAAGGSGEELSVIIRAFNTGDDIGILRLVLYNVRSIPVWTKDVIQCPTFVTEFVEHLSTRDAPFTLEILTCRRNPNIPGDSARVGPFLIPDPASQSQSRLACSPLRSFPPTPACSDAVSHANPAAVAAQRACDKARRDRAERDADGAVAGAAYVATAAFAAIAAAFFVAGPIGKLIAAGLALIALVAFITALVFSRLAADANSRYLEDLAAFNEARRRYQEAMMAVNAHCCPDQVMIQAIADCTA